jgi:arginase family enzyme
MDFRDLFSPCTISFSDIKESSDNDREKIFFKTLFWDDEQEIDLTAVKVAVIGVPESRNSTQNYSCSLAPDEIRKAFYSLYVWDQNINIVDLGNLKIGLTADDTYSMLSDVLAWLIDRSIIPIVLGGSNDLTFSNYLAYKQLEQYVNMVAVDACFDIGSDELPIRSDAYLNKIVLNQPNFLRNYTHIAYQTYLNSSTSIHLMEKLMFETYRVGLVRQQLDEIEPVLRNANIVSIDIAAVRKPDAPGNPHGSANGLYGEEICQIARYAGLSDMVSSFGIYEFDPVLDYHNQTSQLIGQILWYFIDGITHRLGESSIKNFKKMKCFMVPVTAYSEELKFYQSEISDRWWMAIPVVGGQKKEDQTYYLPCSTRDYNLACNDIIPDRWWNAFKKINS